MGGKDLTIRGESRDGTNWASLRTREIIMGAAVDETLKTACP